MEKKFFFDYTTRHNLPKIRFTKIRKPKYQGIVGSEKKKVIPEPEIKWK